MLQAAGAALALLAVILHPLEQAALVVSACNLPSAALQLTTLAAAVVLAALLAVGAALVVAAAAVLARRTTFLEAKQHPAQQTLAVAVAVLLPEQ
jgi:hypothetical protein